MRSKKEFAGANILTAITLILVFLFGFEAIFVFAQTPDDYGVANSGNYCPKLSITIQRGARDASYGGQVSELQRFIADYYDIDPDKMVTGFFGRITQGYVQQFQREQGLPAFGITGSMTRATIAKVCASNSLNDTKQAIPNTTETAPTAPATTYAPVPVNPSISFQASPATIGTVQNSTLSWNTSNASRCVLRYGSSEESVPINGSKAVSPSQTTSYVLWCANDPGTGKDGPAAEKTISVSVASPSCALTANKSSYQYGETIVFSWTSQNATHASF